MNIMPGFGIAMGAISGAAELAAWVAAVEGDGGTVSAARQEIVGNLIDSLKADGIWNKLDRLFLLAAENTQSALRDIVHAEQATLVLTPDFTVDEGYFTTTAASEAVDTNYNPTSHGVNYTQNSAHLSAWVFNTNTAVSGSSGAIIGAGNSNIYAPFGGDNNFYGRINDSPESGGQGTASTRRGLWHINRSGSGATQLYHDGALHSSPNANSGTMPNLDVYVCSLNSGGTVVNESVNTISIASMGGSLTSGEAADFYTHLNAYMTAIVAQTALEDWVAEVVSNGGAVSTARQELVYDLIAGLVEDGIWAKLDRLWLFAAEDEESALTDLKGLTLATNNNSTTFTVDEGFTGNNSNMYIETNFDPTSGSNNYVRDAADAGFWSNTAAADNNGIGGSSNNLLQFEIYPRYTDNHRYFRINNTSEIASPGTVSDGSGLYMANRSGASAIAMYVNGSSEFTGSPSSNAIGSPATFWALKWQGVPSSSQCSAMIIGGGLSSGNHADLYTRLQTYMTAVGL